MMILIIIGFALGIIDIGHAISLSQTFPSYSPVCPGDDVVFTCIGNGAVFWRTTNNGQILGFATPNNSVDSILEIFKVSLISVVNNSYESTATVYNINITQTNELIECSDDENMFNSGTITVIQDLGDFLPPTAVSVTAVNSSTVLLSWSPLVTDHPMCIAGYTITHDNTQFNISNITTFIKSDLSQGNNSFTINGRDKKGTLGETSDTVTIDLSVPSTVINLQNCIIYNETCAVTIILIWEPPDKAHRPPVINYNIYHNITSPDSHVTTMNITQYMIPNISCGYTYYFSISPENVVGIGENTTIYVQVQEYTNSSISSSVAIEVSKTVTTTEGISRNNVSHTESVSTIISSSVPQFTATTEVSTSFVSSYSSSISSSSNVTKIQDQNDHIIIISTTVGITITAFIIIVVFILTLTIVIRFKSQRYKLSKCTLSGESDAINGQQNSTFCESTSDPTYTAVLKKPQPTPLCQYDEVAPPVPQYNWEDDPPKIPPYMGGDEPPPLKPSGGEYSVLQREERNQKEGKLENIPPGLYSTINQRKDEPFVLEPSGKEYSVLKRSEREQRERENNPQLESSGSGQYSVLNQNVGNKNTGAGGIIYADLGAAPKNRPIVPPPSGFSEPVVYSSVTNPPPVPKRLSQKKKDMIYAQLQLELPPSVTPPPPPSVNIQQEKVIYSSVNKQL